MNEVHWANLKELLGEDERLCIGGLNSSFRSRAPIPRFRVSTEPSPLGPRQGERLSGCFPDLWIRNFVRSSAGSSVSARGAVGAARHVLLSGFNRSASVM